MKFLSFVFLVGVLLLSFQMRAQSYDARITGTLEYDSHEYIPNVTITLYQGYDSITSTKTDVNGSFLMEVELLDQTEYYLKLIDGMPEYLSKDELTIQTGMYRSDFVFNMVYPEPRTEYFGGQVAYYQPKEVKKIEEFEVQQILSIIEKHPEICIQFSQTIIHSESEKTAKKRKVNFLKFLEKNGVDMSCIQFEKDPRFLRAFDEDQRSRIQGAIYSLDSKCK
ncbi:MAG: hypothetical protein HRT58_08035 [Crocinitomicaceae bacterium]|nr:hypothetical protein [Flavobacteriales bacterium]NQZ35599.1 hypothetical protein [Crocinitomicaceae bacterium]